MSRLSLKKDFKDGTILYGEQMNTNNKATELAVNDNYDKIQNLQSLKADITDVTDKLALKVDNTLFNDAINSLESTKANRSELNTKADKSEVSLKADKSYVDEQLATKVNTSTYTSGLATKANKSDVDTALSLKANKSDIYTKNETNTLINNATSTKADTSYVNNQLALKANSSDVYTKEETDAKVDAAFDSKADLSYVNNQLALKADNSIIGNVNNLKTESKVIVDAINELNVGGSSVTNIDNKTITKNDSGAIQTIGVLNFNGNEIALKTWTGTKEQYDSIETKDFNTFYYITDDYDEPELLKNKANVIVEEFGSDDEYPSVNAVRNFIKKLVATDGTGIKVGYGANVGNSSIAVGRGANSSNNAVALGTQTTSPPHSIAIGYLAASKEGSIVIGTQAVTPNSKVFRIGSDVYPIDKLEIVTSTGLKTIDVDSLYNILQ